MLNDPNNPNNFNRDEFNETLDQLLDIMKLEAQQKELNGAQEIIERLTQFCEYFEVIRNARNPKTLSNHEELLEQVDVKFARCPIGGCK